MRDGSIRLGRTGSSTEQTLAQIAVEPAPSERHVSGRLDSVDLLRGIVMVVMALDHVRDFFTDVRFQPLDLSQTTLALGLTRWVTHFCAPVFVFLAGTGAFLSLTRGKTRRELSLFLLTRGVWLVVLELTVVRFGWFLNFDYSFAIGQVIWAIGCSMIVLSGLIYAPPLLITLFGVAMILLHNLADGIDPGTLGIFGWPWQILHTGGPIQYFPGHVFAAVYPLVPWIGVMAAGYGFGRILQLDERARRRTLMRLGLGLSLAFIVLRLTNFYGNPHPWAAQKSAALTVLSFINCEKYPPSLLYLLMTLGPAIALLPVLERWKGFGSNFFLTFGRVPLFYYVLHIPLVHAIAVVAGFLTGYNPGFMFANVPPWEWPAGYGFSLPVVYAVWISVVLLLYPVCRMYAEFKRKHKSVWLSYL